MATTWNPSDKEANMVLSNTNHTASLSVNVNSAVRGTTSHASGKWYFEMTSVSSGTARAWYGVANSSFVLNANSQSGAWAIVGVGSPSVGNFVDGGGGGVPNLSPGMGAPDGHTLCVAVDLDRTPAQLWTRYDNGNWNNNGSANPASNTGGENMDGVSGAQLFPFVSYQGIGTCNVTLNAGDSAFNQSAPAGFTPWGNTPALPVANFGTVIA